MELDDELCLCFHIRKRKVVNFIKLEKPRVVSQLSECGGAGTGCGWCRPFLKKIFDASGEVADEKLPSQDQYRHAREKYIDAGKGTPPASN